jgi:acetolactate synthase I/II/III large subunit
MCSATPAHEFAAAIRGAGMRWIYGVPGGGANLDLIGAAEAVGCQFVLAHTEAAATMMAGVTAELTGLVGAALVTRGPGAASAMNGAAQALLDRQPLLLVADTVPHSDKTRISHQRLDQVSMFRSVTKATVCLGSGGQAVTALDAITLARAGRPGPVYVEIDVSAPSAIVEGADFSLPGPMASYEDSVEIARRAVRSAVRPVVIAGVGAVATVPEARSRAETGLRRFARAGNVPVLTTYKGRGLVPDLSPEAAGLATGATIEAPLLETADLIIGVGLDPVELIPAPWTYTAPVVTIGSWASSDSDFFGDRVIADVVGDIGPVLDELAAELRTEWTRGCGQAYRRATNDLLRSALPAVSGQGMSPQEVVTIALRSAPADATATVDAGAHMLVAMPLWEADAPGDLLVSSGLATMGYALPAAIAAALVRRQRAVVCFTGDGGLGMVLAELETLARLRLRVVVIVFNDSTLSLIAVKQRPAGQGDTRAVSYVPTDFAAIAAGYGVAATRVSDADAYAKALEEAWRRDGPTLVDVIVDPSPYPGILEVIRGGRTVNH